MSTVIESKCIDNVEAILYGAVNDISNMASRIDNVEDRIESHGYITCDGCISLVDRAVRNMIEAMTEKLSDFYSKQDLEYFQSDEFLERVKIL